MSVGIKIKKPKFEIGQEVYVRLYEGGYFKGLIYGIKCDYRFESFNDPEYWIVEIFDNHGLIEYSCPSDGWTEDMISMVCKF